MRIFKDNECQDDKKQTPPLPSSESDFKGKAAPRQPIRTSGIWLQLHHLNPACLGKKIIFSRARLTPPVLPSKMTSVVGSEWRLHPYLGSQAVPTVPFPYSTSFCCYRERILWWEESPLNLASKTSNPSPGCRRGQTQQPIWNCSRLWTVLSFNCEQVLSCSSFGQAWGLSLQAKLVSKLPDVMTIHLPWQ